MSGERGDCHGCARVANKENEEGRNMSAERGDCHGCAPVANKENEEGVAG